MSRWLWLTIVILVIIYLSYYTRAITTITILQTTLGDFQFDMLYEKQPIVIQDEIADISQVLEAWFPNNAKTVGTLAPAEWVQNRHKYLMIQAQSEGDLYLVNSSAIMGVDGLPDPQSQALVGIHLRPGQVVILPFKMRYSPADGFAAATVGIHDHITGYIGHLL